MTSGSFDVAVIGGAPGMTGAALLAGTAALHGGAGRVFVALLDAAAPSVDMRQPELMLRSAASLDLKSMVVVCGCGGGNAVRHELARVISTAARAVLDADDPFAGGDVVPMRLGVPPEIVRIDLG